MNKTNKKNLTDITDLSDAALDVLLAVKTGEECVVVEHLSPTERASVCKALGVEAPHYWIANESYPARTEGGFGGPRVGPDFEAMILAEQEADESRWT